MSNDLELNLRFLQEANVSLKLEKDKMYTFYDFSVLKSEVIKENKTVKNELFDNFFERLSFKLKFPREER